MASSKLSPCILLEVSIWYAANPIFTNGRQYMELRDELDRFIDLVRQLNRVATSDHAADEIQRVNTEMHASVDAMISMAGSSARGEAGAETSDATGSEPGKQAAT